MDTQNEPSVRINKEKEKPSVTRINKNRLERLYNRIHYLERKLTSGFSKAPDLDNAEVAALRWAVKIVERYLKVNEDRFNRINQANREGSIRKEAAPDDDNAVSDPENCCGYSV